MIYIVKTPNQNIKYTRAPLESLADCGTCVAHPLVLYKILSKSHSEIMGKVKLESGFQCTGFLAMTLDIVAKQDWVTNPNS